MADQNDEVVLFRSPTSDVYVAAMPNGKLAITDGISTDYVAIRGLGDWVRDSDQLAISQEIRDFLSSVDSAETAIQRGSASAAQEHAEYIITIRSRTTFGTDKEAIRVFPGQEVFDVAKRIADGYGAEVLTIENPDGTPARKRVYDFPNGFRNEAQSMYGWLRHAGFDPEWDSGIRDGMYRYGITILETQAPGLHSLQRGDPARWGNPPEVEQMLARSKEEAEAQQKANAAKLEAMTAEQREWIEVIHYESGLHVGEALALHEKLHDLAAKHLKLCEMDLKKGLSAAQERARDAIEVEIGDAIKNVKGFKEAVCLYDARGTTVGVRLESGRYNSPAEGGIYKIPLAPNAVSSLDEESFWKPYADAAQKELVERLEEAGASPAVAADAADRLVRLATIHTKLAALQSEDLLSLYGIYDDDELVDAKGDVRAAIRAVVNGIDGIKDVEFSSDPRYSTVMLKLASGRFNRMSGGWGVPVNEEEVESREEGDYKVDLAAITENPFNPRVKNDTNADKYVVLSISNTRNAAFADVGRDYEVSRIIGEAADKIERDLLMPPQGRENIPVHFPLYDINGNRVGLVECTNVAPQGEPADGTVRLAVKLGGAAFAEDPNNEAARIFREAAAKVRDGEHVFSMRDINGNLVGKFEMRDEPSLDKDGVIDMQEALSGDVYSADYAGIADGEYRFLIPTPDFEPGYGQGEGEMWLVNAKGEKSGDTHTVREVNLQELTRDQKSDLRAVVEGRMSFEDYERRFSDDDPEPN